MGGGGVYVVCHSVSLFARLFVRHIFFVSAHNPSLEDIKGRGVDKALWKLVPQMNSRREECCSVCVCPAVRDHESGLVTSSYNCALCLKVLLWRNVNLVEQEVTIIMHIRIQA